MRNKDAQPGRAVRAKKAFRIHEGMSVPGDYVYGTPIAKGTQGIITGAAWGYKFSKHYVSVKIGGHKADVDIRCLELA